MRRVFIIVAWLAFADAARSDYSLADPALKVVRLDTDPRESFLAVRVDPMGRIFVGGREGLFVYEPDAKGGHAPRVELIRFPKDAWVYDIEFRGNDLYVLTVSALYRIPGGVIQRKNLKVEKLLWGVPMGHVHQCFHGLAWGPEGDLYLSMGDPLWYYGDFSRPDHWGHWTFFTKGESKYPYNGVGGIFRLKPDGSNFQVVARGLRNSCGLAFDRRFQLFTNDNDHESLPSLYVPGRLLHVAPHADFGWPRGWMVHKTPDRADLLQTMCDDLGRFVPVGMCYYDDTHLPEKYRDNLFLARWCTRAITRYPLKPRGASFQTKEEPFFAGKDVVRPVGVSVGRGGRVFATLSYMAHNENSPIYKSDLVMITRSDDPATHPFEPYDPTTSEEGKLWSELSEPSWQRRYRAHQEILRRGGDLLKQAGKRLGQARPGDAATPHLVWLSAANELGSLHLAARVTDADPLVRLQAVRALTEHPQLLHDYPLLVNRLLDDDAQVRHAAVSAFFQPKFDLVNVARRIIVKGPARDKDTYLRQAGTHLLARRSTFAQLEQLCGDDDAATRLAGVLAVGARLTLPPVFGELPDHLPLAKLRNEDAYVIDFFDGPVDLRKLGRVGNYTLAEHWKAGKHSADQSTMFTLLQTRLKDSDESVRLQSAHFLSLLNDPRTEAAVAKVRAASAARRLATAPLNKIAEVWMAGPFPDAGKGLRTVHPPQQGPVDLDAVYPVGKKRLSWKKVKPEYRLDLGKLFEPADDVSYFAHFRLDSAGKTPGQLLVGSDDGIRVWHNGKQVFSKDGPRAALPFQDEVLLDLEPGGNDFLVRVNNLTGDCALYLHYRALGQVTAIVPEKLGASLADRLKTAKNVKIDKSFLEADWSKAVAQGNVEQGRKLFAALSCSKCHAVSNAAPVSGGPSLADASKRFTIPYLVESILLPGKQVSPVFRATLIETKSGQAITGLVVQETAESLDLLLPDATRKTIALTQVQERRLVPDSPMPAGVVRTPEELRDLVAYLLRPE